LHARQHAALFPVNSMQVVGLRDERDVAMTKNCFDTRVMRVHPPRASFFFPIWVTRIDFENRPIFLTPDGNALNTCRNTTGVYRPDELYTFSVTPHAWNVTSTTTSLPMRTITGATSVEIDIQQLAFPH
jgi:hypothetical protein